MPSVDLPESVRTLRQALPIEVVELLDYPRDLSDAAHEHADGHHSVIYHYAAHKLLAECSHVEEADAEIELQHMGMRPASYNEYASALAYVVIRTRYMCEVTDALTSYRDALQEARASVEVSPYEDPGDAEPVIFGVYADLDAIAAVLDG